MSRTLRIFGTLPWSYVLLFDTAALIAALLAVLLLLGNPTPSANARNLNIVKTSAGNAALSKRIAITFDDSPRGAGLLMERADRAPMLIKAMQRSGVRQAAFFVNPGRISVGSGHEAELLNYARAGHVLANHTAEHKALPRVSPDIFLADIDAAEDWLKGKKGYRPWFRYPQLAQGGRDTAKRDAVRAALKQRGLIHGYVTADGWDWYLERLAERAIKAGKPVNRAALRDLYVETHLLSANFADDLAKRAVGRSPAHVLLLHETDLAALYLPDLITALRRDGWTIITADEAYADPMAKLPPTVIAAADGTLIQMLSWEHGVKGPRWFERNERDVMEKLFNARVVGSPMQNTDKAGA